MRLKSCASPAVVFRRLCQRVRMVDDCRWVEIPLGLLQSVYIFAVDHFGLVPTNVCICKALHSDLTVTLQ